MLLFLAQNLHEPIPVATLELERIPEEPEESKRVLIRLGYAVKLWSDNAARS